MTRTVFPFTSPEIAFWISVSLSTSRDAVASSNRMTGASFKSARAMERRLHSPPESVDSVFSDHGLVAVWQFFNKCMTACRLCSSDHFPQTSAGVCAKISLTTLSFPATILSTLPHSRHNNPGEKVQYSTKRNRACKQQYQFQKITKPINKKMIVSDAKSSPNIGKYLIFSPLSNLFQFFHNKSKQLCLFPPSQKTDRHKMPLSTVPSQNFHLQNKYHFLHCLYETKSALFQPVENQHC